MLADIYTDQEHGNVLNQNWLEFSRRSNIILQELRAANADVICL